MNVQVVPNESWPSWPLYHYSSIVDCFRKMFDGTHTTNLITRSSKLHHIFCLGTSPILSRSIPSCHSSQEHTLRQRFALAYATSWRFIRMSSFKRNTTTRLFMSFRTTRAPEGLKVMSSKTIGNPKLSELYGLIQVLFTVSGDGTRRTPNNQASSPF